MHELVNGAIGGANIGSNNSYGMSSAWGSKGVMGAVQKNLKDNGAQAVATVVLAPVAAKLVKRLARGPIRDMNKLLKMSGVQSATGVKI